MSSRLRNYNVASAYLKSAYFVWNPAPSRMYVDKFSFDGDNYWNGNDSSSPTGPINSWVEFRGGGNRDWWEADFSGAPSPLWGTFSVDLVFGFEGMSLTCDISGYINQAPLPTNTPQPPPAPSNTPGPTNTSGPPPPTNTSAPPTTEPTMPPPPE